MIDISDVLISTDPEAVKKNRNLLASKRAAVMADLMVVDSLTRANKAACKHPNRRYYSDGSHCDQCGYST